MGTLDCFNIATNRRTDLLGMKLVYHFLKTGCCWVGLRCFFTVRISIVKCTEWTLHICINRFIRSLVMKHLEALCIFSQRNLFAGPVNETAMYASSSLTLKGINEVGWKMITFRGMNQLYFIHSVFSPIWCNETETHRPFIRTWKSNSSQLCNMSMLYLISTSLWSYDEVALMKVLGSSGGDICFINTVCPAHYGLQKAAMVSFFKQIESTISENPI